MYTIFKKSILAPEICLMEVSAPRVASGTTRTIRHCQGKQSQERVPLTICDFDRVAGSVTIVTQRVGASSVKYSLLKREAFADFAGPLGMPSNLSTTVTRCCAEKYLFIAGGLGTAPVYPR